MTIPNMSDEQLRKAFREVEQAAYNHEQWAETLFGTLICRLPPDQRDTSGDAHRKCRFGQWYYSSGIAALESQSGFAEIGIEHERMHRYAANLLQASLSNEPIPVKDYDRFLTALKRMRLEFATVRRELEEAIFNLDPLTGTPSRIGMLSSLREQQSLVKRKVLLCTIAMMDLDHFKAVNDKYGHLIGDKVLIAIARFVMAHLRGYDKVFRYGGEEFLICLPDTGLQSAHAIIERLREQLAELLHESDRNEAFHVTVSFGLAALDPDIPMEQSVDRADKALYVAKATGRNRAVCWSASMNEASSESERSA